VTDRCPFCGGRHCDEWEAIRAARDAGWPRHRTSIHGAKPVEDIAELAADVPMSDADFEAFLDALPSRGDDGEVRCSTPESATIALALTALMVAVGAYLGWRLVR
jgi:hypothetical protein